MYTYNKETISEKLELKSALKSYMKQKQINKYVFMFNGLIYLGTGLLLLFNDIYFMIAIPYLLLGVAVYTVAVAIVRIFQNHTSKIGFTELIGGSVSFVLIIFAPDVAGIMLSIFISLWCFIIAFIRFVTAFQCKKDKTKGVISNVLMGLFLSALGIAKVAVPKMDFVLLARLVGLYLCIYAVTQFDEFLTQLFAKEAYSARRHVRISLPGFITAFFPLNFVKEMRKAIYNGSVRPEELSVKKIDEPNDMEVLIHTSDIWPSLGGHVDIAFGDRVISYGNYDDASMYLMGIAGEGVLESVKRIPYIKFCVSYSQKLIVSYGLKLNDDEKNAIKKAIDDLFEQTVSWEPPAKEFERKKQVLAKTEATDYASELYKATGADFYKFETGSKYKSYFGLYMNCAKVTDDILGHLGIDKISFGGIFSPGTYLNFFNSEFARKDSIVISKKVYTPQTILKLT